MECKTKSTSENGMMCCWAKINKKHFFLINSGLWIFRFESGYGGEATGKNREQSYGYKKFYKKIWNEESTLNQACWKYRLFFPREPNVLIWLEVFLSILSAFRADPGREYNTQENFQEFFHIFQYWIHKN